MKRFYFSSLVALVALGSTLAIAADQKFKRVPDHPMMTTQSGVTSLVDKRTVHERERARFDGVLSPEAVFPTSAEVFSNETVPTATPMQAAAMLLPPNAAAYRGTLFGISPSQRGGSWNQINIATGAGSALFSNSDLYNAGTPDPQCAAVRDGIIYIPYYYELTVRDVYMQWKRVDLATGASLTPINVPNLDYILAAMCYDPEEDVFYGMNYINDADYTYANNIVKIDPNNNFKLTHLADLTAEAGNFIVAMCYYPPEHAILGLRDDGTLVQFNKRNGLPQTIAKLNAGSDNYGQLGIPSNFQTQGSRPLFYSPKDEALVTAASVNSGTTNILYGINPEDGNMETIGTLRNGYMMLYSPDLYAVNDAPAEITLDDFSLVEASLSGSVTFTTPGYLYSGLELNENMDVVVKIDETSVFEGKMAPAETKAVNFTTTEGNHTLSLTPSLGEDLQGPTITKRFYAGNDIPFAPTGLALKDYKLTWRAPGAIGVNNGYVQTSALTYDVYFDNKKQNAAPLTSTEFTVAIPDQLERVSITVTATANGKESAKSSAISEVIGRANSIPYECIPTPEQAKTFIVVDGNRDGNTFEYSPEEMAFKTERYNGEGANEWLFLPLLNFDSTENAYEVSYDLSLLRTDPDFELYSAEDLDVCIGKEPTAAGMTQTIYEIRKFQNLGVSAPPERMSHVFSVNEPGDYYIGFRNRTGEGYGILISSIMVQKGGTSHVPAKVSDIKIVAGEKGALNANVTFKLPSVDLIGKALEANSNVKASVRTNAETVSVEGKPGETVTAVVKADQGTNNFYIQTSNENGVGMTTSGRAYIGVDKPTQAKNLTYYTSDDNQKLFMSWEMPTTGMNGGYVDPAALTTDIRYLNGVRWDLVKDGIPGTEYTFEPGYDTAAAWTVAPIPKNSVGYTTTQLPRAYDQLGVPYEMPFRERFAPTGRTYAGWHFQRLANEPSEFSYVRTVADSEMPIFGISGFPGFSNGGGQVIANYLGTSGDLLFRAPKVRTIGVDHPAIELVYYNLDGMPKMTFRGRNNVDQEWKTISETIAFDPEHPNEFKTFELNLDPETFGNKDWAQIAIYCEIGTGAYGFIDTFTFFDNVNFDASVYALEGHNYSKVGETTEFTATLVNSGIEPIITGTAWLEVVGDGQVLAARSQNFRLRNTGQQMAISFSFPALQEYTNYKKLEVRARLESEDDEVSANNSRSLNWEVTPTELPIVGDLKGAWNDDHSAVTLTWSEPDLEYGNQLDFENVQPWAITDKIGDWKNIDEDGLMPYAIEQFAYNGTPWKNIGTPRAWQVVDASALGSLIMDDSRLYPHSGKQYILAMSGYDPEDEGTAKKTADWLISPEIVGGTTLSYWVTTWDPAQREVCEIWVSTTDDNIKSFTRKLGNLTKSGSAGWEFASMQLPSDAKYVAIKYTGWNNMGYIIDDLTFTPKTLNKWEIVGYNVYRHCGDYTDFHKVGSTTTTSFTDELGDENGYYVVMPVVKTEVGEKQSPRSNQVAMWSTGVNTVDAVTGISGGVGEINITGFNGKQVAVYSTDGKLVAASKLVSDNATVIASAGIYLVRVDNKTVKVVVR